jgi:cellulose synthase/poly-beta-1,6-N-acetylglucosamine synthase-like glycosyltransferase
MNVAIVVCFWLSFVLLAHAYAGYPLVLWVLARLGMGRSSSGGRKDSEDCPLVSLLVAAHNEESVIDAKIENCAHLDYPIEKIEILLGSDGSTDATVERARRHGLPNLRVFDFPERGGKASVLNRLAQAAQGEILAFSDANTMFDPQAMRLLVDGFEDAKVGCVSGRLRLVSPNANPGGRGEGLYWRYETAIKRLESRLGAVIGANGAIYAIRRELFVAIPGGTINDDFFLSAKVLEQGWRSIYRPEAEASEQTATSLAGEYRRHLRDAAGHFQVLALTWRLLNPMGGRVAFGYFSHRVIRWFAPFLLGVMLVASALLAGHPLYRAMFTMQAVGYGLALLGYCGMRLRMRIGPLFVPLYVGMVHLALLMGLVRHLTGRQSAAWTPERTRGV